MSSSVSPRDEVNAIVTLCELFGYGRVMQVASETWERRDPIGAFIVVCCAASRSLYSAAPELLEALKGEATVIDGKLCWCGMPGMIPYCGHDSGCEYNRELIAKVEGES